MNNAPTTTAATVRHFQDQTIDDEVFTVLISTHTFPTRDKALIFAKFNAATVDFTHEFEVFDHDIDMISNIFFGTLD